MFTFVKKNVLHLTRPCYVVFIFVISFSSLYAMDKLSTQGVENGDEVDLVSLSASGRISEPATPSSSSKIRNERSMSENQSVTGRLKKITHLNLVRRDVASLSILNCILTNIDFWATESYKRCISIEQCEIIQTTKSLWQACSIACKTLKKSEVNEFLKDCLHPKCPLTSQVTFPLRIFSQVVLGKAINELFASNINPIFGVCLGLGINFIEDAGLTGTIRFTTGLGNSLIYASMITLMGQCKEMFKQNYDQYKIMNLAKIKERLKKIQ